MIPLAQKVFWFLIIVSGSTSIGFAQSAFLQVPATPYDRQMARIEPTLTVRSGHATDRLSFALVNQWMIELRAMPYRYSREWRTPSEVEAMRMGDCKGKALTLYDRMELNGARNLRFIIGKRRANDSLTHAWLEWETKIGTVLLDPTFNWTAAMKAGDRRSYIAFYGYEGAHKYRVANSLLASRTPGIRSPAAPSQGAITSPTRSTWGTRPNPRLFNEGPISPRSFPIRTTWLSHSLSP
jgi:hypothetical protein